MWQECYDESTGYPYYWHIETNEVTWDMPEELRLLQKQSEVGPGTKHPVQGPHWVDFSSIKCNYHFVNFSTSSISKRNDIDEYLLQIGNPKQIYRKV